MKVLLYEHVCGGGYAGQPLPMGVLAEGYGMLRSVAEDLKAAGHEVTVMLDSRISKLNPPLAADCTIPTGYAGEYRSILKVAAQINDAVLVVAPETNQTLQSMVQAAEETKKVVLNSSSKAIAEVANKALLYAALKRSLIPTPKTLILNVNDPHAAERAVNGELGYPAVFKPIDGTGCSGISLLQNPSDIAGALYKVKSESSSHLFIAQQYIKGESASVSLIADGKKAVALTLNRQQINLSNATCDSCYGGGAVPFEHPRRADAFALAARSVEAFGGLRGYIGVDVILGEGTVFVVDVNARLTTSYVGLRRVANLNVAEAIIQSVTAGKLPVNPETSGFACFQKTSTRRSSKNAYQKSLSISGVVAPPFSIDDNGAATALVMGYGASLAEAQLQLSEANKSLLGIL
ncbi:MAG: ATP-grasp domain-containing protein [Candidatus Bathyarchaeota archaeon]|nr:ATP-grasp domain-containing protein [Candidatus Bathyarchaeota archaeon]